MVPVRRDSKASADSAGGDVTFSVNGLYLSKFVLRVGADNKIEYTPVKLGPLVDGLRVVREGLKVNDVIVVKGLQQVRPGMPVTPQLVAMGEARRGNTLVAQN